MHELSICRRIVDSALEEFERLDPKPCRIISVRVVVGRMHQIVPDYLISAFEILARETVAEGGTMELVVAPVICQCSACGRLGEIELPIFRCNTCGSPDLEISGGKELYLDRMEIEWSDEAAKQNRSLAHNSTT